MAAMQQVDVASEYNPREMEATGRASGMLIRQHRFPFTYGEGEIVFSLDHDRVATEENFRQAVREIIPADREGRRPSLWAFFLKANPEIIRRFIAAVASPHAHSYSDARWTGFRVLASINRGSGYPVWHLQLFAKRPRSRTPVYSNEAAPNVQCCCFALDGEREPAQGAYPGWV
jgi:hypothetical protein